jgi:hypothetical protein
MGSQSVSRSVGQSVSRSVGQSVSRSVGQSVSRSVGQSVSRSVGQSVSHGSGIPIGNLTSQIFANIYLNEFDRFVRHTLKPLGYVRYGDDFVLFLRNETDAWEMQAVATKWLVAILKLQVHRKNNVILSAKAGLHFLGHIIHSDSPLEVDRTMIRKIERDIDYRNFASYQAMALPKRYAKQLPWRIID